MIKKAIKYLKIILLLAVGLILSYLLFALILSLISTNPKNTSCPKNTQIFVSTNGVHLDIILPVASLSADFRQELKLESHFNYSAFGWGDQGFYLETPTWNELKFSTAINAIFLKSKTAMHLTKYRNQKKNWHSISVCESQEKIVVEYIIDSFARNSEGKLIPIPNSGYTLIDEFHEANGTYNFINTCNSWVNKGLKMAKIKTSIWSPFDKGVLYHIENNK